MKLAIIINEMDWRKDITQWEIIFQRQSVEVMILSDQVCRIFITSLTGTFGALEDY